MFRSILQITRRQLTFTPALSWYERVPSLQLVHGQRRFLASKTSYMCEACGAVTQKWSGRCGACGEWGTIKEYNQPERSTSSRKTSRGPVERTWLHGAGIQGPGLIPLGEARVDDSVRLHLSSSEIERVFGGGIMPGSVTLLGGTPGVGKSTFLLQLAELLTASGRPTGEGEAMARDVILVSGEESPSQIRHRANRMGFSNNPHLLILNETNMHEVMHEIIPRASDTCAVLVDSIQTMYLDDVTGTAGSVTQVRECALELLRLAKANGIIVLLIGHVTKSGEMAGPRVLEHLVDTVVYVEGDGTQPSRLLRVAKNRFGSTSEVAVLEMTEKGLCEMDDCGSFFLSAKPGDDLPPPGRAVAVTLEGSRPICIELQALCSPTAFEYPKHRSQGLFLDRLHMLLAVLSRHTKLHPRQQDVFFNVAGGLRMSDPGADLGAAAALASSILGHPIPSDVAFIGEVGLGGEIRRVSSLEQRISMAAQVGFKQIVVPKSSTKAGGNRRLLGKAANQPNEGLKTATLPKGVEIHECGNLVAAFKAGGLFE